MRRHNESEMVPLQSHSNSSSDDQEEQLGEEINPQDDNHKKTLIRRSTPRYLRKQSYEYEQIKTHDPSTTIQSLNYEPDESEIYRDYLQAKQVNSVYRNLDSKFWDANKQRELLRWIITFFIGVIQALVAAICNYYSRSLTLYKFTLVEKYLEEHDTVQAFIYYTFLQTLFAAIACFFVYVEPMSAGSGIPEIKCFLNGIDLPRITRVKTLLCKVMGVTFSVAAGLPVGKEGPMVHSGSVVASCTSYFFGFVEDAEQRDFVACGAASGVASAFGAPIGGVLFSCEEGASYWSTKLTCRSFFCAMSTMATLFFLRNVDVSWQKANIAKLFSFGEFSSFSGEPFAEFSVWELPLFICIGCLGGCIGAAFNHANMRLTKWRMKHVHTSFHKRFSEVILVAILVSVVSFGMSLIWTRCSALPEDRHHWLSNQKATLVDSLVPFICPEPSKQYNEVASLIFTEADVAVKQLFHLAEGGEDGYVDSTFTSGALLCFLIPYICLAAVTYGIAIPSGLFVPSLLSGAAFGRLCGHLFRKVASCFSSTGNIPLSDSGTYALMGAAAVLGGMARMTISLTIILLEATGNMQYGLSLMFILLAARLIGNIFNEGLYDIHIHLKKIHFLEPELPAIAEQYDIVASQVMNSNVQYLNPIEKVGVVHDLLQDTFHHNFPILIDHSTKQNSHQEGNGLLLYGSITRNILCTLINERAFGNHCEDDYLDEIKYDSKRKSPLLSWETFQKHSTIAVTDDLSEDDRNSWLDLRPYANTAPYTVNETASIQRTYRLFRTLGLRFLCVVNHHNQVVGVITRKDLLADSLADSVHRDRTFHPLHSFDH